MDQVFTLKYNRTTNHIEGLDIRTAGTEMEYSKNACPSLSRGTRFATSNLGGDIREALRLARITGGRKLCKHCEKAAEAMIAELDAAEAAELAAAEVEVEVEAPATETVAPLSLREMRALEGFTSFGLTVMGEITAILRESAGTYRVLDANAKELARGLKSLEEAGAA